MTPQDVLNDPHWFPAQFDLNADTITFLKTDRAQLSAGAFLDQRFYRQNDTFQAVRLLHLMVHKTVLVLVMLVKLLLTPIEIRQDQLATLMVTTHLSFLANCAASH